MLRDEVVAFACAIEQELQSSQLESWKERNAFHILDDLNTELADMEISMRIGDPVEKITTQCARLGLQLMMIMDVIGGIGMITEEAK